MSRSLVPHQLTFFPRFLTDDTFFYSFKDKFKVAFCNFFVDLRRNVNQWLIGSVYLHILQILQILFCYFNAIANSKGWLCHVRLRAMLSFWRHPAWDEFSRSRLPLNVSVLIKNFDFYLPQSLWGCSENYLQRKSKKMLQWMNEWIITWEMFCRENRPVSRFYLDGV